MNGAVYSLQFIDDGKYMYQHLMNFKYRVERSNDLSLLLQYTYKFLLYIPLQERDSSVGIATRYGLDGPGSNPGVDDIFCTRPDRPWGPPSLLYNGYRVFPGG